ncbi:MAG: Vacuolar protein sorting-associated protein 8 [Lichina confinis]|nr:MAG: Vacuolar protein sorting-associated protein 8 [Lichina confinis]
MSSSPVSESSGNNVEENANGSPLRAQALQARRNDESGSPWQGETGPSATMEQATDDLGVLDDNRSSFAETYRHTDLEHTLDGDSERGSEYGLDIPVAAPGATLTAGYDSPSTPDDSPSVQGSVPSSPGSGPFGSRASFSRGSPTPSLRPFDRRFQSRLASSPLVSPRPQSPAFLDNNSRRSSLDFQVLRGKGDEDSPQAPWDIVRWIKLKKLVTQLFSERGKRSLGNPICMAVSAFIALGTSKGVILIFDYNQDLKSIMGPGTEAVEAGPVLSLAMSADQTIIAGGHANGSIFTWELARSAKPFMRVPPITPQDMQGRPKHGHVINTGVLHLSFLGARRTALTSADGRGMAFSHLATRGMGVVARSVATTRILGRYPSDVASGGRPRKPSSVLAFSALPLGNVEKSTDTMGLVAMLTPYLLVIVSTMPIAQTQHKAGRPKEITPHGALSGCLAWFPSVKLRAVGKAGVEASSEAKLVYCWSDVLTVGDLTEQEATDANGAEQPPVLSFRARNRWKAGESIVAVQWMSRSVLAILTITQQLVILEDNTMTMMGHVDLLNKQIMHHDFFSRHLHTLVERLDGDDDEDPSMHGVVADAFYASFRLYKGRIFLLDRNDIAVGAMSNWTDRLTALLDDGRHIDAIRLATHYFLGDVDTLTVGLPKDDRARHMMVEEKLLEIVSNSLQNALQGRHGGNRRAPDLLDLKDLCGACFDACFAMANYEFLFDDVYDIFEESTKVGVYYDQLGACISQGQVRSVPPSVVKGLVEHHLAKEAGDQLEEMLCVMDTSSMDIDQITTLCKRHHLYDAFTYIWNQTFGDYVTPLVELMSFLIPSPAFQSESDESSSLVSLHTTNALKIFPYLSYVLTGRVYPTGEDLPAEAAAEAKSQLFSFLFAGTTVTWPKLGGKRLLTQSEGDPEPPFPYLRLLLHFDTASFLSALNEAFEDAFLNNAPETQGRGTGSSLSDRPSSHKMNRQHILSILWEVLYTEEFGPEQTIYLDMFVARNLPKFPQFILLPGSSLQRVLLDLCDYPSRDIAEDCQLSVEYLLSMYRPPDLGSLTPSFKRAGFHRVLKSIYRAEKQYPDLLEECFEDPEDQTEVFPYLEDFLRQHSKVKERQLGEVRKAVARHAADLVSLDVVRTAEIIERYTPSWHESLLESVEVGPRERFEYLRAMLEPRSEAYAEGIAPNRRAKQVFVEDYVRLMSRYDPSHVADYISSVQAGDLRLAEVLPDLENQGVVDAAVIIVAREGRVRDAMGRLLDHLSSLEAALVGLLNAVVDGVSDHATWDAIPQTLDAMQKYSRVGVWLCQRQMKSTRLLEARKKTAGRRQSLEDELSFEEVLWLDLIEGTVRIVKNATAILSVPNNGDPPSQELGQQTDPSIAHGNITQSLRGLVQETFSALLTSTSSGTVTKLEDDAAAEKGRASTTATAPSLASSVPSSASRLDLSFLRILRAFLARASVTSPSLSELRAVLSSIFSAYAYEESLLSLSNKLLQDDLFVHVEEASNLRQRGWRPRSQLCEGCGKRVWGPGAGGGIWEAWRQKTATRIGRQRRHEGGPAVASHLGGGQAGYRGPSETIQATSALDSSKAKGKGIDRIPDRKDDDDDGDDNSYHQVERTAVKYEQTRSSDSGLSSLLIFSCQHIFHRTCFDRSRRSQRDDGSSGSSMTHPVVPASPPGRNGESKLNAGDSAEMRCTACNGRRMNI